MNADGNGNGSAGRARLRDALPAPAYAVGWNSYCLICAHWYFGRYEAACERCHSPIFRWVATPELRLFRSGTPLGRMAG